MIVASVRSSVCKYRTLAAAVALGAGLLPASQAGAVGAAVRFACAGDYLSHCSSFSPDSAETRKCMRAVGYQLSKGCISALVAAGEISKTEVARRQASQH
jgi:hypothetical protein